MERKYKEEAIDYLQQTVTLISKGNYEDAVTIVKKALEIEPQYADAYSVLSDAYANLEKYPEAMEAQKKVLLLEPENGEAYFDMGSLYILTDDMYKGVEYYNKADQKGFHKFPLYKNLAQIYREIQEEDLALRNYNKAIECEPLRADIRLEKAGYYVLLGKFREALETLENLQKIEPDLYEAFDLRAEIYCGLGEFKEALELIDKAVEQLPDDAALVALRIKILIRMNRIADAKKEIARAKTMDAFEMASRNILLEEAQIFSMEKDMENTIKVLQTIIRDTPEDVFDGEAAFLLMNAYYGAGKYPEVLKIASELAEQDGEDLYTVSAKYFIPFILKKQGKMAEAAPKFKELTAYLRRLTVRDPHFYEGYIYRTLCHKELGEYDKALELTDYMEALDENSTDAYALRYAIYNEMGEKEKAEEAKARAEAINPHILL